jgi:ComF family protein
MKFKPLHDFLSLLYPDLCVVCSENLQGHEAHVCSSCLNSLPKTNFHQVPNNLLEQRLWGKVNFHRATAFFYFHKGSPFQKILHSLKYKGKKEVGETLGKHAAVELSTSEEFTSIDMIIPVPLHPNRIKTRGYNQSEWIAKGISEILDKPLDNSLIRTKDTKSQTRKSVYDRYKNTDGIFHLTNSDSLVNKHILLVDDVMTTGATFEACIQALSHVEGIKISAFALAMAT